MSTGRMEMGYSIRDFYLLLKLGIFRQGMVDNWGLISLADGLPLRKLPDEYITGLYYTRLDANICLLDFYPLYGSHVSSYKEFVFVIGVCEPDRPMRVAVLKLTSANEGHYLKTAIERSEPAATRKLLFRRKRRAPFFDGGPINEHPVVNTI